MARIRMTRVGELRIRELTDDEVGKLTKAVGRDVRRRVPVDTGELLESVREEHRGARGRVYVGTEHWRPTEYGSAPHVIRSTGPWPLRSRETGQVFGPVVHHPGTPAQPFMRPAIYKRRVL